MMIGPPNKYDFDPKRMTLQGCLTTSLRLILFLSLLLLLLWVVLKYTPVGV